MQNILNSIRRRIKRQSTWASNLFNMELEDLGSTSAHLRGIHMPVCEMGEEKLGLSEQFLANASQYNVRYAASDDSTDLFRNAISAINWTPGRQMTILDIGTGSGANSVVPCLRIFEGCRIVATDLSPDLLAFLQIYLETENLGHRVSCICTNAMNNHFKNGSFDVVLGAAILHHLVDPSAALDTAYKALKPGGIAMFIEPFEGYSLLAHAFTQILDDSNDVDRILGTEATAFLNAMCIDLNARKGTDKSDVRFRYMDDKWLFTRTYIEAQSAYAGFKRTTIVPHITADPTVHYRNSTEILIRCAGMDPSTILPPWAWDKIAAFDRLFSPEMKRDALLEGTIVLQK